MTSPWRELLARARTEPGSPLLTLRDGIDRVELSVATALNGASKIANALEEEGLGEGSTLALHLPWHWQRSLWCAAARAVGAEVVPFGTGCDLLVCTAQTIAGDSGLVVSMHPLGLDGGETLPRGFVAAAPIVMSQPDAFAGAGDFAAQWPEPASEVPTGERVVVACAQSADGWPWAFEVPMARRLSLVLCPPLPEADLERIAAEERADRVVVLDGGPGQLAETGANGGAEPPFAPVSGANG